MSYVSEWADALADVAEAGAPVSFSDPSSGGTYNTDVGTMDGTAPVTVTGKAVRVRGNPLRYQALSLIESSAPTLLFVPDIYGQLPTLDMSVPWAGETYNVKDVSPIDPDGLGAIAAKIVVAR